MIGLRVASDALPPRTSLAHLDTDEVVALARERDRLADRLTERFREPDRDGEREAHPSGHLRGRRERDGRGRPELAVFEPDELAILSRRHARRCRRESATRRELRVGGASETHLALPFGVDTDGFVARGDPNDLERAATTARRECQHLDARIAGVIEDREGQRILDEKCLGPTRPEQRQTEALS